MRIFICDSCKKEFSEPLDQEEHVDIHGVIHIFDLCAPCRKKLKEDEDKPKKDLLKKMSK